MDAVTYPQESVVSFLSSKVVPLRLKFDAQPYASNYKIKWTPTLITADAAGEEHHRSVGFLAPEALIPSVLLGSAKCHFDAGRFPDALSELGELLAQYPKSPAAPEALYYQGVAGYKNTNDAKHLKAAYEKLAAQHPGSEWAQRAYPYRLL